MAIPGLPMFVKPEKPDNPYGREGRIIANPPQNRQAPYRRYNPLADAFEEPSIAVVKGQRHAPYLEPCGPAGHRLGQPRLSATRSPLVLRRTARLRMWLHRYRGRRLSLRLGSTGVRHERRNDSQHAASGTTPPRQHAVRGCASEAADDAHCAAAPAARRGSSAAAVGTAAAIARNHEGSRLSASSMSASRHRAAVRCRVSRRLSGGSRSPFKQCDAVVMEGPSSRCIATHIQIKPS